MKKIPKKEEVSFTSCKSKDGSTLSFDLKITDSTSNPPHIFPFKSEFAVAPHPDLTKRLEKLKPRLMENFGWTILNNLSSSDDFEASPGQQKYLKNAEEAIEGNLRVTGVQYIGKDNTGAIVKGTYDGSPINTKIYFTNQDYGEDMEQLVSEIADEVYEYVYNNKRLQLEAFAD